MNEKLKEQTKVLYEEEKQTKVKVIWKDNEQIMVTLICTPDKVEELNELIRFVKNLDF